MNAAASNVVEREDGRVKAGIVVFIGELLWCRKTTVLEYSIL
jgi:hypothetical protein